MRRIDPVTLKQLLTATYSRWSAQNAPRMGAALAYYTLLSIAPLMILVVMICGLVFKNSAETHVLRQTADVMGPAAAKTLKGILDNSHHVRSGIFATAVALVTLLFGASGVFMELRSALNGMWEVPRRVSAGASGVWRGAVWQRLTSFAMVLALGILLLASLLLSAGFAVVQKFATGYLPLSAAITGEVLNFVLSTVALGVLFSLVFRYVPARRLPWPVITTGGAATAVLFSIGKSLLTIYLTTAAVGSTYGAAGSVVAFMVWVYYSAQIFFFGAVFTNVYAASRPARAAGRP
jgi:membrane protein